MMSCQMHSAAASMMEPGQLLQDTSSSRWAVLVAVESLHTCAEGLVCQRAAQTGGPPDKEQAGPTLCGCPYFCLNSDLGSCCVDHAEYRRRPTGSNGHPTMAGRKLTTLLTAATAASSHAAAIRQLSRRTTMHHYTPRQQQGSRHLQMQRPPPSQLV